MPGGSAGPTNGSVSGLEAVILVSFAFGARFVVRFLFGWCRRQA
jgi:hypothetical protein